MDDSRTSANAPKPELPVLRPKIYPVRYDATPDNRGGLFIRNDGEVAFDVTVEDATVGTDELKFWNGIANFAKDDGEALIRASIEISPRNGLTWDGLRDRMVKFDLWAIPLLIKYKDADNRGYRTLVKLERDITGISTRYLGQELGDSAEETKNRL
jgi:hypothetical protein